jgi:hypothetical protein
MVDLGLERVAGEKSKRGGFKQESKVLHIETVEDNEIVPPHCSLFEIVTGIR